MDDDAILVRASLLEQKKRKPGETPYPEQDLFRW